MTYHTIVQAEMYDTAFEKTVISIAQDSNGLQDYKGYKNLYTFIFDTKEDAENFRKQVQDLEPILDFGIYLDVNPFKGKYSWQK